MNTRKASAGHWLTQSVLEDEANRIFVHEVAGFGDLDNLYKEVSDQEKQEWDAAHPQEEV